MKVVLSVISAAAIVVAGAGVSEAGIGFRATGGLSHISYGDFNDWVDEVNYLLAGSSEYSDIKWVPEIGGEFYYSIVPMFEIGLGGGMIMGKSDYSISAGDISTSFEHKVKGFPINANIYFKPNIPFASMKPYVFIGGGTYYTKLNFEVYSNYGGEQKRTSELSSWGWGIHGGGGLEFSIIPSLSLDLGVKIRWASIDGFKGTTTDLSGKTYDVYLLKGVDPDTHLPVFGPGDEDEKKIYDEGKVDLTGYTIYIGFKAGF